MRIDISKGYFIFEFDIDDTQFNCASDSILNAKSSFLNYISNKIDDEIYRQMLQLSKIQQEINNNK